MKKILYIIILLSFISCGKEKVDIPTDNMNQSPSEEIMETLVPVNEVAAPQEFPTSTSTFESPSLFE